MDIYKKIQHLKKQKNALLLAHNYQSAEIQDSADVVGDSLELARIARNNAASLIVLCGVYFMTESAKILAPAKTVLLPRLDAGCPMADMVTPEHIHALRLKNPDAAVVCYINSSAAVKAVSDVCCTSSNAVTVVKNIPNKKIIFVPDQNLGYYVSTQVDKEIILHPGFCATHHRLTKDDVLALKLKNPDAVVLVHPECNKDVLSVANVIASTSGMILYVRESKAASFIIGTEEGILHRMRKDNPHKNFYLANNRLVCPNMKKTTLDDVYTVLRDETNAITVPESIRTQALHALDKMLEYTG